MTKHGCYNTPRQSGYWANDGYWVSHTGDACRLVAMGQLLIKDEMTPDCQYAIGVPDDPKCEGCEKKGRTMSNETLPAQGPVDVNVMPLDEQTRMDTRGASELLTDSTP